MPSGQDDALQTTALAVHPAVGGGSAASISQRLHVLFAAALLLLNFPLLALWDHAVLLFGLPLFPLALFTIWAALIAVLARWMEQLPD